MLGFLRNKTNQTHTFRMVIHVDGDPRNKVRDVEGEFTFGEDGDTVEEVQQGIAEHCEEELGASVFVVSFDYR